MDCISKKPSDALKNRREYILKKAEEIVNGEREGQYGTPENNFAIIADFWNIYLNNIHNFKDQVIDIEPKDVAEMMILMKIARCTSGQYKDDNYIDICGYAAIAAELGEE